MLLEAKNISVFYGAVKAIEDISFHVKKGEIVAMIGPNGAGKSTALKAVFGMVDIHSGDIYFKSKSTGRCFTSLWHQGFLNSPI